MEKENKKRGFLNGWDALVILGITAIGIGTLDNFINNKISLRLRKIDLEIEKERTKQSVNNNVINK